MLLIRRNSFKALVSVEIEIDITRGPIKKSNRVSADQNSSRNNLKRAWSEIEKRCEEATFHRTTAPQGEHCEMEFSPNDGRAGKFMRKTKSVACFRAHFSTQMFIFRSLRVFFSGEEVRGD